MMDFMNDMAFVGFMVEEEKRRVMREAVDAMYSVCGEFDSNYLEEYFYDEGIDLEDSDMFYLFDYMEEGKY